MLRIGQWEVGHHNPTKAMTWATINSSLSRYQGNFRGFGSTHVLVFLLTYFVSIAGVQSRVWHTWLDGLVGGLSVTRLKIFSRAWNLRLICTLVALYFVESVCFDTWGFDVCDCQSKHVGSLSNVMLLSPSYCDWLKIRRNLIDYSMFNFLSASYDKIFMIALSSASMTLLLV